MGLRGAMPSSIGNLLFLMILLIKVIADESDQMKLQVSAIQNHPLMEISESPGHLLLLKLFQREERINEISQLFTFYTSFFHMLCLPLLFASTLNNPKTSCSTWWIPSMVSLSLLLFVIFVVQVRVYKYWKVRRQMDKLWSENRSLSKCVVELRMKGRNFDLGKGVVSSKRVMKRSSVEMKWRPISWTS
uniref:Transmembrane protein n=1 Tax=Kalanchoe fedtschenkoi TaxID=63787 RepID=A0A7N0UB15_KALFE